jgi:DNA-binding transcriptional regulator YhcF (GntR family)
LASATTRGMTLPPGPMSPVSRLVPSTHTAETAGTEAAGPGERLPLAKDLAAVLGVNKNTVLRALHLLREEGLLEFRRGRGITVVGTPQRGAVLARARELVEFARRHGLGRDEVIQMIQGLP